MDYILKGHSRADDVVSMLMLFFPNLKYAKCESVPDEGIACLSERLEDGCRAVIYENGERKAEAFEKMRFFDVKEEKRAIGMSIKKAVECICDVHVPWGILTGVRPAKFVTVLKEEGLSDSEIMTQLRVDYAVSESKARLAVTVSEYEEAIVAKGKNKIGLYIGIPFCPTRCLYCSFTSYPLKQYAKKVDTYLDALEKEMQFVGDLVKGKNIESLYIGGGTPTSLNELQLERLLGMVNKYFDKPEEYTVEAGRPDTITRQKLKSLKDFGVGRISINPQTLNDETLKLVGREHTTEMFLKAFEMAREEGHNHINTDIILGLPGEGAVQVENTMKGLERLSPESITVHTLAVKRASRLRETLEKYNMTDARVMDELIGISAEYTSAMGMHPYYMYRQKNMVGNFENVGYCKEGCECVYNVAIMEEKQSIWALGAGGSTKIVDNSTDRIERVFNVKSVDDYITRLDEMLERKKAVLEMF